MCTPSDTNFIFILLLLLLLYYWLQVSASNGHHQANTYKKKLKMLVHIVKKRQFCGIPLTFTSGLIKDYYQLLYVPNSVNTE
jgi:hypothetical protein